jgi:hypothetical protein
MVMHYEADDFTMWKKVLLNRTLILVEVALEVFYLLYSKLKSSQQLCPDCVLCGDLVNVSTRTFRLHKVEG